MEEFRKRKAAFAMASKLGMETYLSIVGIDQVNKFLGEAFENESVSTVFRVLPANDMGGFGQYYGDCPLTRRIFPACLMSAVSLLFPTQRLCYVLLPVSWF